MRILHEKGVETSQDKSLMSVPSIINVQIILRSRVRISGDKEVDDPEQEHPKGCSNSRCFLDHS